MNKIKIYKAENEPVLGYHKGSKERLDVEKTYNQMFNSKVDVPLYIGSEEILTENRKDILPPHDHKNIVGTFSQASEKHVNDAIENLIQNKSSWSNTPWEKRCDIFLKAADLLSDKYRAKITAGTMIGGPLGGAVGANLGKMGSDQIQRLFGGGQTPEERRMEEALAALRGGVI